MKSVGASVLGIRELMPGNMVLNCDLFLFALYLVPAYEMWEQNVDYGQSKLTAAKAPNSCVA